MNNFRYSQSPTRRRKVATMKHLVRCCRLHGTARIRQVLGQMFALRGRTYRYYDPAVDCNQPDPMLEISRTARDTAAILARAPEGVREWISQATVSLCDDAKRRIAAEITAHCQDGLSALEAAGMSREAAEARVLEGLGDPAQANAAFQKTYLTSAQERYMARIHRLTQSQYMVLYMAIMCLCFGAILEFILTLAKALGWFQTDTLMFYSDSGIPLSLLVYARLGFFNDKSEQRYLVWVKRPLERNTVWILFAFLACFYASLGSNTSPEVSRLHGVAVMLPFLYGAVHRAIIRDIVAWLPNAPRARVYLMFGYSGALFTLAMGATKFFHWIIDLGVTDHHHNAMYPLSIFFGEAVPAVIGLLWFGGHAMIGAFFVSKAKPVETRCPETPLGE